MNNLSVNQILSAEFTLYESNPVIKNSGASPIVADPSLLTPDKSPDGLWHIFFHTTFGVWHASSADGIKFGKGEKICPRAMRPDINFIDGKYLLYYEHTRPLLFNALNIAGLAKWNSEIYVTESADLVNWSEPKPVITHTRGYEKSERGVSISNPFLLKTDDEYRLYYSCGLTFIKDCGFCEPTYISLARSNSPVSGFVSEEKPIISPDPAGRYTNLCSGCLKVYKVSDGFIGIQNGIYSLEGESRSAIMLLTSRDGISFEFAKMLLEPDPAVTWMAQYVYASHLVRYGDELRLYFNARNRADMLRGRECIGFARAKI